MLLIMRRNSNKSPILLGIKRSTVFIDLASEKLTKAISMARNVFALHFVIFNRVFLFSVHVPPFFSIFGNKCLPVYLNPWERQVRLCCANVFSETTNHIALETIQSKCCLCSHIGTTIVKNSNNNDIIRSVPVFTMVSKDLIHSVCRGVVCWS
jgi:hypothetical protein